MGNVVAYGPAPQTLSPLNDRSMATLLASNISSISSQLLGFSLAGVLRRFLSAISHTLARCPGKRRTVQHSPQEPLEE
jgi:hypothetical protein